MRGTVKRVLGIGVDILADILGGIRRVLGVIGFGLAWEMRRLTPRGRIAVVAALLAAAAAGFLSWWFLWPHPRAVVIVDDGRIIRLETVIDTEAILDGDTFRIDVGGAPDIGRKDSLLTIRLYGVDCPEKRQAFGPEAGDAARSLLEEAGLVTIVVVGREKYGRAMAVVGLGRARPAGFVAGVSGGAAEGHTARKGRRETKEEKRERKERLESAVSGLRTLQEALVEDGLAWVYDAFCDGEFCEAWRGLQKDAKRARRGLWADRHPVAPWEWRERK